MTEAAATVAGRGSSWSRRVRLPACRRTGRASCRKLVPPAGGGSVGALSRYVCALLTSVDVRSHKLPTRRRGTNRVDHAWALQVDPSAMHNVRREAFEGMRPALLCRSRERGTCSVLRTRISVGLSLSDNEGQGHVDRSEHDRGRAY
jgi:hypothetical protein